MFLTKESLALVLCRPSLLVMAFVFGIVLIVRGEIGGGVCLYRLNQSKISHRLTFGPMRLGKSVAVDTRFGQRSTVILLFIADYEETGEGGIRTLGSLLGYGALAKRCFRPLSHLTKSKARISQAILDFQFVICIRGHRFRRLPAISSELPIADC
jgi:hypothetical protein